MPKTRPSDTADTPRPAKPSTSTDAEHAAGNPLRPAYKADWPEAKCRHARWWRGDDLVLALTAPLDVPREQVPDPGVPEGPRDKYIAVPGRARRHLHQMSRTRFAAGEGKVSGTVFVVMGLIPGLPRGRKVDSINSVPDTFSLP